MQTVSHILLHIPTRTVVITVQHFSAWEINHRFPESTHDPHTLLVYAHIKKGTENMREEILLRFLQHTRVCAQHFYLDLRRCKTGRVTITLLKLRTSPVMFRAESHSCEENEHAALRLGRSDVFFPQSVRHTKCSPTCLASSGESNSLFTDCPLYTSHSNLFK